MEEMAVNAVLGNYSKIFKKPLLYTFLPNDKGLTTNLLVLGGL